MADAKHITEIAENIKLTICKIIYPLYNKIVLLLTYNRQ